MHSPRPGEKKISSRQSRERTLWFFVYFRAVRFRAHARESMLYVWESSSYDRTARCINS